VYPSVELFFEFIVFDKGCPLRARLPCGPRFSGHIKTFRGMEVQKLYRETQPSAFPPSHLSEPGCTYLRESNPNEPTPYNPNGSAALGPFSFTVRGQNLEDSALRSSTGHTFTQLEWLKRANRNLKAHQRHQLFRVCFFSGEGRYRKRGAPNGRLQSYASQGTQPVKDFYHPW
jgi:hypothetical protein